jgi:phospholipid/cholesterol/gamma-HCH transport system substrate-binding protein
MSVLERPAAAAPSSPYPAPAGPAGARWQKARRRLGGVAFLAVLALLAWLSVALYHKQFTPVAMVTLETASTGNEMHVGAYVMVRGVQVGEVRSISANGRGATLGLAIQPGELSYIPANVTAEMLPTTLFGERYVDLIVPPHPSAARLTAGDVISQDRSRNAIEVEQVLNSLLPMLSSLQPAQLSITLTAIAQGLRGRGAELGRSLVQLNSYLRSTNPSLPALDADIRELSGLAATYNSAAPDIIQALRDFAVTSQTVAAERSSLSALYATLTTASSDLHSFLAANSSNMIHLAVNSVGTLRILGRYAPEFPCTLRDLVKFEPAMNKVLGKGTRQPGLHARVVVVPVYASARYLPAVNTPVYQDNLGPHCYPVPFKGISLNDGTGAATTSAARPARPARPALAASGAESELVREISALQLGRSPASVPGWSDLLLGPLLRGATVRLEAARS